MEINQYIDGYYVGVDGVRKNVKKDPVPPSKKYTDQFVYSKSVGSQQSLRKVSY